MKSILGYTRTSLDTFDERPFCQVDSLVLSSIAYTFFPKEILPEGDWNGIHFADLLKAECFEQMFHGIWNGKSCLELLIALACSPRFRDILICGYTQKYDAATEKQFSAVTFRLTPDTSYIAFRGTDSSIIGWKEDFNLSTGVVPAQERAVEYLRRIAGSLQEMVRVGGHSKGGNLAVYGAVMCKEIHPWILQVYSNDGPGFSREFLELPETEALLPKVTRIIPEYSIIGTLLEHSKEPVLVASSNKGLLQHDGFSWEVSGNHFASKEQLSSRAETFVSILHKWIDGMDVEQKKVLIEDLFSTIEASGSENLSEIQAGGLKSFTAMLKRIESFAPESREMVQELFLALFGGWLEQLKLPDMEKIPFLPQSFSDKILEKF